MKTKKKEFCEKCKTTRNMTNHHILPKARFKEKGKVITLCKQCHYDIENVYKNAEGRVSGGRNWLEDFEYYDLYYKWLWGDYEFN